MLRVNLTIAMVAMVYPTTSNSHSNTTIENTYSLNNTGNIPKINSTHEVPSQLVSVYLFPSLSKKLYFSLHINLNIPFQNTHIFIFLFLKNTKM